jgi:NAD(P)-dependent dehydrogenase (short-subunit alcohol dehydrogenase family)
MNLDLAGKSALVTGASLGIGKAIAMELAQEGVNVVINARNAERLAATAAEISAATGMRVVAEAGDMAVAGDVLRVVERVRSEFGRIDILINNAGSSPAGRIEEVSDETWLKSLTLKPMGYVRCARAVVRRPRRPACGPLRCCGGAAAAAANSARADLRRERHGRALRLAATAARAHGARARLWRARRLGLRGLCAARAAAGRCSGYGG